MPEVAAGMYLKKPSLKVSGCSAFFGFDIERQELHAHQTHVS